VAGHFRAIIHAQSGSLTLLRTDRPGGIIPQCREPVAWRLHDPPRLNLLHRAGWYDEADIANVRLFAQLALPGILTIQGVAE